MFSDEDICKVIKTKELVIDPFKKKLCLTPAGYDACVGDTAWIVQKRKKIDIRADGVLVIPARCTALIGTEENIELSRDLIGFVVSKVSLCAKGLSHISTSLDPGWKGPLLVPVHNWDNIPISIEYHQSFCTLMFDRVYTTSTVDHNKPPYRKDISNFIDHLAHQATRRRDSWKAIVGSPWTRGLWILFSMIAIGLVLHYKYGCTLETAVVAGASVGVVVATWLLTFGSRD